MVHQSCSYLKLKGQTYYFSHRVPKCLWLLKYLEPWASTVLLVPSACISCGQILISLGYSKAKTIDFA